MKEEMLQDVDKKSVNGKDATKSWEDSKENVYPSVENIQKVLASDAFVQQARVQESVERQKDGRENVLEAEIKSDTLYGMDTTAKKEELSASRRKKSLEIEELDQPNNPPNYIMDSGAKIIIRA